MLGPRTCIHFVPTPRTRRSRRRHSLVSHNCKQHASEELRRKIRQKRGQRYPGLVPRQRPVAGSEDAGVGLAVLLAYRVWEIAMREDAFRNTRRHAQDKGVAPNTCPAKISPLTTMSALMRYGLLERAAVARPLESAKKRVPYVIRTPQNSAHVVYSARLSSGPNRRFDGETLKEVWAERWRCADGRRSRSNSSCILSARIR